ncbi:MAG: DUF1080 domain-containing protein [Verrucomicrobiales bacterium]|nr:DUF1080 domain-containing protein [Verrucomicrobiales bacterium]
MNTTFRLAPRRLFVPLVPLVLAAALSSAQAASLTREQISDGWIQLFDGGTLFGWQPRGEAQWSVEDGVITAKTGSGAGFLVTTTEFADFRLRADFWVDADANSGVFLRCPTEGAITDVNAYEVNIADVHEQWPTGSINRTGRTTGKPATIGHWNTYDLTAEGDRLIVRLNGEVVLDAKDNRQARGCVALQYRGAGQVKFRNVILQPRGLGSIFNGKDLSGWREIPDRKSVYSVTPEGWLNVRDGNGDLQSEGRYGDFTFQLDIISNGEHLNSGVFFRALPGQFWSGYESQIRNQWQGNDRTQPVDYGTGGIYNRQPARRVVASDHQWFTKTIVAHGRHLAVWVDGHQVSDWTDPRSPNENARQGYRAAPGVLSLQGHDPTTDLSFRNLRIAEMPAAR